jgi:SsrA-binding protein
MKNSPEKRLNILNKRARFDYFIERTEVAGIQLVGTEVKAIKDGNISLVDSYCTIEEGELFVRGLNIPQNKTHFQHDPNRIKKLLLRKNEIKKMEKDLIKGMTIIPCRVFKNERGLIKVEVGLAKGKKNYDKRESIKNREADRKIRNGEE